MRVVVSDADPPNHGAIASPSIYLEITPASRTLETFLTFPIVPEGSSV
jgi:hypothetical protein